jgi:hypothetical protein
MKRFCLFLLSVALLLTTCGEDSGINSSGGGEYVLQYPDESYPMALVEARTLRAPDKLVKQIDRELVMIRERFGEDYPLIMTPFRKPWDTIYIYISVDDSLRNGTAPAAVAIIDSVARANDSHLDSNLTGVRPEHPWHPPAAVELFAGLSGVRRVHTASTWIAQWFTSIMRLETDGRVTYYFSYNNCGDYIDFYRFDFRGSRPHFEGVFKPCHWAYDLPWLGPDFEMPENAWVGYDVYLDSVLATRQAWVDTAEAARVSLHDDHVVQWLRD